MIRKTISMPDNMGDWIAGRNDRGQYNNESEYFRDLVRRDQQEEERKAYLHARIMQGEAQLANGQFTELDSDSDVDQLFASLDDGQS